jgi:hypothetical protein
MQVLMPQHLGQKRDGRGRLFVAFTPASPGGIATVPTLIGNFLIGSGICRPGPGNDPPWQLQAPGITQRQVVVVGGTAHATDVPTLSITPAGGSLVTIAYTMTADSIPLATGAITLGRMVGSNPLCRLRGLPRWARWITALAASRCRRPRIHFS